MKLTYLLSFSSIVECVIRDLVWLTCMVLYGSPWSTAFSYSVRLCNIVLFFIPCFLFALVVKFL